MILGCCALVVGATMTLTYLTSPVYRASTTLEIERHSPEIVEFKEVVSVDTTSYLEFQRTQQRILESRTVAGLAAEDLDLPNRPEFAQRPPAPIARVVGWATSLIFREPSESSGAGEDVADRAARHILNGLTVTPIPISNLVTISFDDRDPVLAADAANAVARAYKAFQHDARYNTTGQAREFLTKEFARAQAEIGALERQLQQYGEDKEILALSERTQDIGEQALTDINRRCTEIAGRLAAAEARLHVDDNASAESMPEVLDNAVIARLREHIAALEREQSRLAERFGPDWPSRTRLAQELKTARSQLESESGAIVAQVRAASRAEYEVARKELATLERQRERQKQKIHRINRAEVDYTALKTEIETKKKVLADLIARQSETTTTYRLRETGTSNIRVVDPARVPRFPISPNKPLNLIVSLISGFCLGAGLALLIDHLDNTVKTEADIQQISGLPVLGHVPLARSFDGGAVLAGRADTSELDLASHLHPQSDLSEAFRNLRTSLLLAVPGRPPRHVLVTSCEPADGKSTVALNLAIVLTQLGRRVLLVDADLRRPRLDKTLRVAGKAGLSSYLSGNAELEEIVQKTEIPGLQIITSGPIPPNPSELLGSPRLDQLLGPFLDDHDYEHLIVDSPPLLSVADSTVLSSRTDSTILVVRSDSTRREALSQSAARLAYSRANVIGTLLNAVSDESGYYHRYYWYRRYGKDENVPVHARKSFGGKSRRRKAG